MLLFRIDEIKSNKIKNIKEGAFIRNMELKELIIPDSVEVIGEHLCYMCASLKKLTIGKGLKVIPDQAFHLMTSLESLTLNEGLQTIHAYAFADAWNLKAISIPDSVETISKEAFYNAYKVETLTIGTQSKLKSIGTKAFAGLKRVESINLPGSLERIDEGAFSDCSKLKHLVLPKSLTVLEENAFQTCKDLQSITIKSSSLRFGGGVFYDTWINNQNVKFSKTLKSSSYEDAGKEIALECENDKFCGCKRGYGNTLSDPEYFNCVQCSIGKTSDGGKQTACSPCAAGKYADNFGQLECTPCGSGKARVLQELGGTVHVLSAKQVSTHRHQVPRHAQIVLLEQHVHILVCQYTPTALLASLRVIPKHNIALFALRENSRFKRQRVLQLLSSGKI